MKRIAFMVLALAGMLLAVAAPAADRNDSRNHPGYADLVAIAGFDGRTTKIEVDVSGWLLSLGKDLGARVHDRDLSVLQGLEAVHIRVFPYQANERADMVKGVDRISTALTKAGWERIVKVNDDDEDVYVYIKGNEKYVEGLSIAALTDDDQVALINIYGHISPDQIAHLIDDHGHFDIDVDI